MVQDCCFYLLFQGSQDDGALEQMTLGGERERFNWRFHVGAAISRPFFCKYPGWRKNGRLITPLHYAVSKSGIEDF